MKPIAYVLFTREQKRGQWGPWQVLSACLPQYREGLERAAECRRRAGEDSHCVAVVALEDAIA